MRKKTGKILAAAAVLMVIGGIMVAVGLLNGAKTTLYWDTKEHHLECKDIDDMYITQEKMKVDQFEYLNIDVNGAKISLIPSDDYYVEYSVLSDDGNPLTIQDGTLTFRDSSRRLFEFNFNFAKKERNEYLIVYYKEGETLRDIKAELDMGSMNMEGVCAERADVDLSMGSLEVKDCSIDHFDAELDMGSLHMERADIGMFKASLAMGELNITEALVREEMDAELDMGSADIELGQEDDKNRKLQYGFDMETDMGSIEIDGRDEGDRYSLPGDIMLKISCDMGSIALNLY